MRLVNKADGLTFWIALRGWVAYNLTITYPENTVGGLIRSSLRRNASSEPRNRKWRRLTIIATALIEISSHG